MSFWDLVVGKKVGAYVLYVDLLGTKSRIRQASVGPTMANLRNVAWTQSWFVSSLAREASRTPTVFVEQLSDCAFAYSEDLEDLCLFSMRVLFRLTNDSTSYNLIPARGAIAQGITHLVSDAEALSAITNFRYSNVVGQGMVDAFEIEQAGEKGMRLFAGETVVPRLPNWVRHRPGTTQPGKTGPAFSELNWMAIEEQGTPVLEILDAYHGNIRGALQKVADTWSTSGNENVKNVGASLIDLIAWI